MDKNVTALVRVMGVMWLLAVTAHAADPAANEAKLRDSLRSALLQLQTCQSDKAALEAAKAETDETNKTLTAKVSSLNKKADATEKTAAEELDENNKLRDAVSKWQAAYQKLTDLAKITESERARLSARSILLRRQVDDYQRKNYELYKVGTEILNRYEHFSLGDALAAKEPFVGLTRVKLENLVQDYRDKLADQRIKP